MNEDERSAGLAETADYRYAEVAGDQLFVAGQVPLDAEGSLVGADDPGRQAEQCLANLATLIKLHGFDPTDVRHLTVHVVGQHEDLLAAWAAVTTWYDHDVPPATLLGVNLLGHANQLVEVDATIVRRVGGSPG